jgi:hypothetical protein
MPRRLVAMLLGCEPALAVPIANTFTEHLEAWAAVVAALGTLAAVLIALYRDTWRAARRRPRLTVSFASENPERYIHIYRDDQGYLPGFRLNVANAKGRDTAHDVEVLVSFWSLRHPPPELGQASEWDQRLENRPLVWANEYETGELITRVAIPPGVSRQLEFVRFGRPRDLQRVIDGGSRAIERPPELSEPELPRPKRKHGGFEVKDDFALLVAPPFDGSDRHILQWHVPHRFRLVATQRDADSVAYDTVLPATRLPDSDASEHSAWVRRSASFLVDWTPLKRAGSPDTSFSVRLP